MHRGTIKKEPTMVLSRPTATTTTTSTSNDQFNNNLVSKIELAYDLPNLSRSHHRR